MAKLYFRYGTMNCGKTTSLLQSIHNYEARELKIFLLKPLIDTKGDNKVVSRIGLERVVDHLVPEGENLFEYLSEHDQDISCIFVDEAQFLKREQVNELQRIVTKHHIPVMCYGLRTDFNQNGFEGSTRLLEISDKIDEMVTICRCGKKAQCNARLVNGEFVFEGNQVAIDGEGKVTYDALCPECYLAEKEKYERKKAEKLENHPKVYQKTTE